MKIDNIYSRLTPTPLNPVSQLITCVCVCEIFCCNKNKNICKNN